MAKIATVSQAVGDRTSQGLPANPGSKVIARGDGWQVTEIVCTSGPRDRPFVEQHANVNVAIVLAGSFQYSSAGRRELMTPGSIMLGNPGQCFECGHEHGTGDRCLSFSYHPDFFAGVNGGTRQFQTLRLAPMRTLSAVVARSSAALGEQSTGWEDLSLELAVAVVANSTAGQPEPVPLSAEARVTRAIRLIEHESHTGLPLATLAQEAGLSPYHFLRTFESLTGLTPHQYVLRTRLRHAAAKLADQAAPPTRILDIALDCGFADISNFNRAFKSEFGMSPRAFRSKTTR